MKDRLAWSPGTFRQPEWLAPVEEHPLLGKAPFYLVPLLLYGPPDLANPSANRRWELLAMLEYRYQQRGLPGPNPYSFERDFRRLDVWLADERDDRRADHIIAILEALQLHEGPWDPFSELLVEHGPPARDEDADKG